MSTDAEHVRQASGEPTTAVTLAAPEPVGPSLFVRTVIRPMTKVLNPLVRKLAGRRHFKMAAQIHHVGRRSGRPYMTPAGARLAGERIVIPLTFGNRSDWAQNVRAAGGCWIRLNGHDYSATGPEFLRVSEAGPLVRSAFSPLERASFRLLGIKQVLSLRAVPADASQQRAAQVPAPSGSRHTPSGSALAITVIAGAQLMVALDVTIVNIALPHIEAALHFSRPSLAWVIDAYTLVFGGLMLVGGRTADFLGRKRMFVIGLALFSLASLAGGLATTGATLIAARAVQGVGGAIASPTALSLVTTVFPEGRQRNRALAAYAGATGGGGILGLIAGGLLTDLLSWRWVLFVNVIIGGLLVLAAPRVIPATARRANRPSLPSALLSVLGIGALVYGFLHAASDGWRNSLTVGSFTLSVFLLTAFVLVQTRSSEPLLPLRLFRNRNRVGSYLMGLSIGAAIFSMFYFLTQFVQEVLGYSPIKAGVAFLPLMVLLGATAQVGGRLISRTGPKPLLIFGAAWVLIALIWLSGISASSTYVGRVLPALIMLGIGIGSFFVPLASTAVAGVTDRDAGIASGAYNMFFQIGGAVGLAALTTVAATAIRSDLSSHPASHAAGSPAQLLHALADGWGTAFAAGTGFAALALFTAVAVVRVRVGEINSAHVH